MKFQIRVVVFFSLFFLSSLVKAQLVDNQRYLALMLLNLGEEPGFGLDQIQESKQLGCNAIHLTIPWNFVYPTATSQPKWQLYDDQIRRCHELGLKVGIRIFVARNAGRLDGFWKPEESVKDERGQVLTNIYGLTSFSFANRTAIDKAKTFVQEVCQRYATYQQQGTITWVSVANTPTQELGYHFNNWPDYDDKRSYPAVYDYSEAMQREFRAWLSRKYAKVSRLNAYWNTDFASFDQIGPPLPQGDFSTTFANSRGRDWFIFRHLMLRNWVEESAAAMRKANPNYRVVADFGSVFDELSSLRSTYSFVDLCRNLDGIKINDDLAYDHHFSTDVIRSNAQGKPIFNEVFFDRGANLTELKKGMLRQIDQNFEHGTNWVSVVITGREQFDLAKDVLQTGAAKWVKKPLERIVANQNMSYTLSQILDYNYKGSGILSEWNNKAGSPDKRQPVNIRLIEDLLANSPENSLNRPPVVTNTFPTKTIALNQGYSYKFPFEAFDDKDGVIAKVEVQNLPTWLKFGNNTLSGMPNRLGTYTVMVRGYDDDGAWVEAPFTIVVENTAKPNQRPVLKKKVNEEVLIHQQSFALSVIDSAYFVDNDGFIVRIEAQNLPIWAQYRKGVLVGTPTTVGVFAIKFVAYDDDNASVEAILTLRVEYPRVRFELLQGGPPGSRKFIQKLQNNDLLSPLNLPQKLNVHASCDAPFTKLILSLKGPTFEEREDTTFPYSLFDGDEGFAVAAGNYQLTGTAINAQNIAVASTTIVFKISAIDPVTQQFQSPIDWMLYPNPFQKVFNLKLPAKVLFKDLTFKITNILGQEWLLDKTQFLIQDQLISINADTLPQGTYWLQVIDKEIVVRKIKLRN